MSERRPWFPEGRFGAGHHERRNQILPHASPLDANPLLTLKSGTNAPLQWRHPSLHPTLDFRNATSGLCGESATSPEGFTNN